MTLQEEKNQNRVEAARDYLCGYRLCMDMLHLKRYERKRAKPFEELCRCEDLLMGNELLWQARMLEIEGLIASLRNGREKLMLYYRYLRGESVEHAADLLGVSRRTGYRILNRGLLVVGILLERREKKDRDV